MIASDLFSVFLLFLNCFNYKEVPIVTLPFFCFLLYKRLRKQFFFTPNAMFTKNSHFELTKSEKGEYF